MIRFEYQLHLLICILKKNDCMTVLLFDSEENKKMVTHFLKVFSNGLSSPSISAPSSDTFSTSLRGSVVLDKIKLLKNLTYEKWNIDHNELQNKKIYKMPNYCNIFEDLF